MQLGHRSATSAHHAFLTTAVLEAERSGTPRSTYERVFELSSDEARAMIATALGEEIPGSELCHESFILALDGDAPVGCIAAWIEGQDGVSSNVTRATLLSSALGIDRWRSAQPRLRLLSEIELERTPGALQIEAVYCAPSHRGRGVVGALIDEALRRARDREPRVERAQILSVVENQSSARAFTRAGFVETRRTRSTSAEVAALFPGTGRILWERSP